MARSEAGAGGALSSGRWARSLRHAIHTPTIGDTMAIAHTPTTRTIGRTDLAPLLRDLIPFRNTTGSLRGERVGAFRPDVFYSWLDDEARAAFYADDDAGRIDYVVWSYGTPIAWHTENGWTMPDKRYSATTSRHQSQVRRGISGANQ